MHTAPVHRLLLSAGASTRCIPPRLQSARAATLKAINDLVVQTAVELRSLRQLSRFRRAINADTVFGTHRRVRYAERRRAGLDETGERGAEPKYTPQTDNRILALLDQPPP